MFIKNASLLFTFWLFFTSQKNTQSNLVIVAYREPETMFGEIKQVIETRLNVHTEPALCRVDTTYFDKNTNPVETRLGDSGHNCVIIHYILNDDVKGKKVEKIIYSNTRTDTFKTDKSELLKNFSSLKRDYTSYTINNSHVATVIFYRSKDDSALKEQFKYLPSGLLSEVDFYSNKDVLKGTCSYAYLSIDQHGNWTKRVSHYRENFGVTVADTIIRKITYYQ